ncbi:MAG: flavin reductase family protein [Muribaculaceae bacterium]|nr:flavin reductase family protein [Muribaculaceae bacterium]
MKESWKPGTVLYPLPAALVSCGHGTDAETSNVFTVAWTGIVCTNPPMLSISVRPERASYPMIRESGEFTVNLTTEAMARATDFCGVRSRRDVPDKWAAAGITPYPGVAVACPAVAESPISLECKVREVKELGSHHLFIADIINVLADTAFMDPASGRFELEKAGLISYSHGRYYAQGPELGHFGFSVKKPASKKKKK